MVEGTTAKKTALEKQRNSEQQLIVIIERVQMGPRKKPERPGLTT